MPITQPTGPSSAPPVNSTPDNEQRTTPSSAVIQYECPVLDSCFAAFYGGDSSEEDDDDSSREHDHQGGGRSDTLPDQRVFCQ